LLLSFPVSIYLVISPSFKVISTHFQVIGYDHHYFTHVY
jgi:hypothetical protein